MNAQNSRFDGIEDYDLDLEAALEVDRTEELQDNLDIEIEDESQAIRGAESLEGFEIVDGFGDNDNPDDDNNAGIETGESDSTADDDESWDQQRDPNADFDEPINIERDEQTTVTDGRHVLDEFGEDVASSPAQQAEVLDGRVDPESPVRLGKSD
ncbi:hypothetical protein [Lysinibacter cavernae]|uniref:DUF5709 domain-containing protein n=1 Tax=Lysinibacter cavernae TaxID=1640652 RepID=A0A7X5TUZ0_9MICO|nr:hypothetical protein [Lysinibacter cavernae]NIH54998.1 hypothetical protein [Lysinibacter cavernae]